MAGIFKFFEKKRNEEKKELPDDQLLMLSFDLDSGEFGDKTELKQVWDLEDKLERLLKEQDAGECDGHDIGDGECLIYLYGPDSEKMLNTVQPILDDFPKKPVRVYQRFGPVEDDNVEEKRHTIT